MSLTQFIGEAHVRERLNEVVPNQGTGASNALKADWRTNNYLLIGTGFDYLLRFWLRRTVPEFHARPWVAETSLKMAEERFPKMESDVRSAIERAKDEREEYLETGEVTASLVESALDLARIDGIYRGGEPPTDLGMYDNPDIDDCIHLMEILDSSNALDGDSVFLNPTFGLASAFVGGADADAILDGIMVDVKTTGNSTYKADYWRQLVGYLVLADVHNTLDAMGTYEQMGKVEDPQFRPLPDIDSFGVYFARHGELSTVESSEVYDSEEYREFRSWFVDEALDTYEPFDRDLNEILRDLL